MKRKAKPKFRMMRFRKGDPVHNVLAAVQHWIHYRGGTAAVLGGVEIQDWGEGPYKYRVAFSVVGQRPIQPQRERGQKERGG